MLPHRHFDQKCLPTIEFSSIPPLDSGAFLPAGNDTDNAVSGESVHLSPRQRRSAAQNYPKTWDLTPNHRFTDFHNSAGVEKEPVSRQTVNMSPNSAQTETITARSGQTERMASHSEQSAGIHSPQQPRQKTVRSPFQEDGTYPRPPQGERLSHWQGGAGKMLSKCIQTERLSSGVIQSMELSLKLWQPKTSSPHLHTPDPMDLTPTGRLSPNYRSFDEVSDTRTPANEMFANISQLEDLDVLNMGAKKESPRHIPSRNVSPRRLQPDDSRLAEGVEQTSCQHCIVCRTCAAQAKQIRPGRHFLLSWKQIFAMNIILSLYIIGGAFLFVELEKYAESKRKKMLINFFNQFLRYGQITARTPAGRLMCVLYGVVGIPLMLLFVGRLDEKLRRMTSRFITHTRLLSCSGRTNQLLNCTLLGVAGVVLLFVGPSFDFTHVEGWSATDSVYYCFVSLSTIGFGDMVVGYSVSPALLNESIGQKIYLLACLVWVLFGLAYVGMVITNLAHLIIRGSCGAYNKETVRLKAELKRLKQKIRAQRRYNRRAGLNFWTSQSSVSTDSRMFQTDAQDQRPQR